MLFPILSCTIREVEETSTYLGNGTYTGPNGEIQKGVSFA